MRRFFGEKTWVEQVVDFGHAKQFFKDADVFPCFLVVRKPNEEVKPDSARLCLIQRDMLRIDQLKSQVESNGLIVNLSRLASSTWSLESDQSNDLLNKIQFRGIALGEYLGASPLMGIKTGCNEAFLVDSRTKDDLIKGDPKVAGLIRPYLRGQDISRWSPQWAGLWMIVIKSSNDHPWPWADLGADAEDEFRRVHPSLHTHLKRFEEVLIRRVDKGRYWWELRSCAYWDEFDSEKIIYQDITWRANYSLDPLKSLTNNTVYFMPRWNYWSLAVLNSPVAWWFSWRKAQHGKDDAIRLFTAFVETFPIPKATEEQLFESETVVRSLISASRERLTTSADVIDWLRVQHGIEEPNTKLRELISLDSDSFVSEVQKSKGMSSRFTAAALRSLRDEYTHTIEPAKLLAAEAQQLEHRLHDLINQAYGLTPEEVRLIWDTAPPRMPIPRPSSV